jgi:hypothetical protein
MVMTVLVISQVSLWDGIIPSKEHAKFLIHTTNKYRFIDQASTLPWLPVKFDVNYLIWYGNGCPLAFQWQGTYVEGQKKNSMDPCLVLFSCSHSL